MKLKRLISVIAASLTAVALMSVNAFAAQNTSALADGTAYLNINNDQWGEFGAKWTNATITGDGTYTVSMTAEEEQNLALFNALEIVNGELLFGRTYTVTIDSVKINGSEKKISDGYTCSADSKAVTTRVNIYNEWNSPENKASDDGNIDCRSADGDFMSKSAKLISDSDLLGVKSIEVKFTVKGTKSASGASGVGNTASGGENTASAPENAVSGDKNSVSDGESAASDENDASSGAPISAGENPIDSDTASVVTGNVPAVAENASAIVMLSIMAAAGTASIASRKRK